MFKRLYHFIGSVYFAVALIAMTALMVVVGTVTEAVSDSHQYAVHHAYGNPVFLLLLALFFVNVLVASLRRYPFSIRHIPFLITHLGLLMILAGVMVKNIFGTQGQMGVIEGGVNNRILLGDTYVIDILKRGEEKSEQVPLQQGKVGVLEVIGYTPHSQETVETWIKGPFAVIEGIKPFPVMQWQGDETFTVGTRVSLPHSPAAYWDFYAYHTQDVAVLAKKLYVEGMLMTFRERATGKVLKKESLAACLEKRISVGDTHVFVTLDFDFSPEIGFVDPHLNVLLDDEKMRIPLSGPEALLSRNMPIAIDLSRTPTIALVYDDDEDSTVFAFDPHGQVFAETFLAHALSSYISYDKGHGGYFVATKIPFTSYLYGREERENKQLAILSEQLERAASHDLAPPLMLFREACQKVGAPFVSSLLEFLEDWERSQALVMEAPPPSLQSIFAAFKWESETQQKGCYWAARFLKGNVHEWPLLEMMKEHYGPDALVQHILMLADELPPMEDPIPPASLLCALMRAYGITLENIRPTELPQTDEQMVLECPLTVKHQPTKPLQKWEDNRPLVRVKVKNETQEQVITLGYDKYAQGLRWPVLGGEYLLRFQPQTQEIPHHVRLRDARQINYPGSNQPYSYESDLLIADTAATVSMNEVYETWDGYRFYLANISPAQEVAAQRIQLVVNRDPAKYILTYPGGLIVALGIVLLFGLKPYR